MYNVRNLCTAFFPSWLLTHNGVLFYSEELRRWFIAQEMDLFRFRFGRESKESVARFLQENNLNYKPVSTLVILIFLANRFVLRTFSFNSKINCPQHTTKEVILGIMSTARMCQLLIMLMWCRIFCTQLFPLSYTSNVRFRNSLHCFSQLKSVQETSKTSSMLYSVLCSACYCDYNYYYEYWLLLLLFWLTICIILPW